MEPIILASQSPRRRELLALYGVPFEVDPSMADEGNVDGSGAERVKKLAQAKCAEVAARHPGRLVLAAGTLYGAITNLLAKGWIETAGEEENSRKKEYIITESGLAVLKNELARLEELVSNGKKVIGE